MVSEPAEEVDPPETESVVVEPVSGLFTGFGSSVGAADSVEEGVSDDSSALPEFSGVTSASASSGAAVCSGVAASSGSAVCSVASVATASSVAAGSLSAGAATAVSPCISPSSAFTAVAYIGRNCAVSSVARRRYETSIFVVEILIVRNRAVLDKS